MRKAHSLLADKLRLGSAVQQKKSAGLNPPETAANLLASGLDASTSELASTAPLQRAAAEGHVDIVHQLIKHGADVNYQDSVHGNSALHEAAWRGYSQTASLLCRHRANVDATNRAGFTALHLCCQNGHNETCRVLLMANANPDAKNHYGDTPLHTSARYGHAGVMRILISAKCNVSEQNKNGDTALHISSAMGRRKLTRILLSAGCPTTVRNKQGETPVEIAQRKEFREILAMLQNPPTATRPGEARKRVKSKSRFKRDKSETIGKEDVAATKAKDRRKGKENGTASGRHHAGHLWSPYGCHDIPDIAAVVHPKSTPAEALKKGEQYYVDLAGNIRKGPIGVQVCYCGPLLHRLECRLDKDKHEILHRLDSTHARIDARITGLERRTQQQIQGLQRVVDTLGLEGSEAGLQRLRNSLVLDELGQATPELPVLDLANSTTSHSHSRVGSSDVSVSRSSDSKKRSAVVEVHPDPTTKPLAPNPSQSNVQYTLDKLGIDPGGLGLSNGHGTNGNLNVLRNHLAIERIREQRELHAIVEHYERRGQQNNGDRDVDSQTEDESDEEPTQSAFSPPTVTAEKTAMLSDARYETYDYPSPMVKPFTIDDTTTSSANMSGEISYRNLPLPRYHLEENSARGFPVENTRTFNHREVLMFPDIECDHHNDSGYSTRPGESSHGPSPSLSGPADSFEMDGMHSPRTSRKVEGFSSKFARDLAGNLPSVLSVKKPWFPATFQPPRVRFAIPQVHQEEDPNEMFPPGTMSSSSLV